MKIKLFLPQIFFYLLLTSFFFLIFVYEKQISKKKIASCNELSYELSKSLFPENFSSLNISLEFLEHRKWKQLILNNYQGFIKNGYFANNKNIRAIINIKLKNNNYCSLKAKIKPHGDLEDHHLPISELPSMQVHLEEGHLFGIVKFLLLKPKTRSSLDDEITAATINTEMGYLSPRTAKANVYSNNKKNIYIFQEKIVKEFIEYNGYRESLLFSNDDRLHYTKYNDPIEVNYYRIYNSKFIVKNEQFINSFEVLNALNKKRKKIEKISNKGAIVTPTNIDLNLMYNDFLNNKFLAFDVFQLGLNAEHAVFYDNKRIYYDFMNKEFLPIYYDGMAKLFPFVQTPIKKNKYIKTGALENLKKFKKLEKDLLASKLLNLGVSKTKSEILSLLIKIEKRLNYLSSDIDNENTIYLDYKNITKINYSNKDYYKAVLLSLNKLLVCDSQELNCSELNINSKDLINLLSQRFNHKNLPVILINKLGKSNEFNFYDKKVKNDNIINVKIDEWNLIIFGNMDYEYDKKEKKLKLIKNSPQARALINNKSTLENIKIVFEDKSKLPEIKNSKLDLIDKRGLTGCLTIYDSILKNVEIKAKNSNCEDAINIVKSKGNINNMYIVNSASDAFDADFANLNVNNFEIYHAENDCIDLSGGNYYLSKLVLDNCLDKGLSAENSNILMKSININNSFYGIAAKDFSKVEINEAILDKVDICWDAYNKKQEFGGGYILIEKYKSGFSCKAKNKTAIGSNIVIRNVF